MTTYAGEVALALFETVACAAVTVGGCVAIARLAFPKRKPPAVKLPEPLPRFYAQKFDGVWQVFDRYHPGIRMPCRYGVYVRSYTTRRAAILGAERLNDRAARGEPYLPEWLRA